MTGNRSVRFAVLVPVVVAAIIFNGRPVEARGLGCITNIMCSVGKAAAGWGVKRLLEGTAPQQPAPQPQEPTYERRPIPPVRVPVCQVVQECRVVATGNCFRISPTTMRCQNERQCRTRRTCG